MSPASEYWTYHLIPADGRDYRSIKAFEDDLYSGKAFIAAGPDRKLYCTITDVPNRCKVQIRYDNLTKTAIIVIDHDRKRP
jgi:hypothetical protein